jgi:hypothetical protein
MVIQYFCRVLCCNFTFCRFGRAFFFHSVYTCISVAARSKVWVYGRSLAGIVGSNPAGGMDVCLF